MAEATHGSIAPPLVPVLRSYRRSAFQRWLGRRSTLAFFMCVPLLAVIVGLVMYPALYAINLSTMNKAMTKHVGVGNFQFLFTRETFWMVVRQSAIFALTAVFFKALIGLITAHLMLRVRRATSGRRSLSRRAAVPRAHGAVSREDSLRARFRPI